MASDTRAGRPPLLAELVGPAGAGKSSLLEALRRRGVVAPATVWGQPIISLLGNALRLVPTLIGLWWHARSLLWEESAHLVRLATLHRAMRTRRLRPEPVIFDEGPLFALVWLRGFGHKAMQSTAASQWWHRALRDWAAIMDAVVVVDAPDALLAQRIRTRPEAHEVKQSSDPEIVAWMGRFREALDWVLQGMTDARGPVVLRVTTEHERPEVLADLVGSAIARVPYDD